MHCYIVSNPEEYSWISSLSIFICYSLFLYSCKNFIEDYTNDTNDINNTNINEIKDIPNFTLSSIKESHDDEYKQKMFQELLDINSLERVYILYFIFKRRCDFKSLTSIEYIDNELTTILTNSYTNNINNINNNIDINDDESEETEKVIYEDSDIETQDEDTDVETDEDIPKEETSETPETIREEKPKETDAKTPELKTYNSYELYTNIMNKIDLNLDETIIPDIQIQIGENKYELTEEKLNFIQWLYYIGLYDYLTDINNIDIKYDILNEMNKKSLLAGNVFLRYQLFLCDYEYEKKLSF